VLPGGIVVTDIGKGGGHRRMSSVVSDPVDGQVWPCVVRSSTTAARVLYAITGRDAFVGVDGVSW